MVWNNPTLYICLFRKTFAFVLDRGSMLSQYLWMVKYLNKLGIV